MRSKGIVMVNLTPLFAGLLAITCTANSARAQEKAEDYPSATIRIVIGFSPGGGSDVSGRVIADKLSAKWGKPVIVENKPGAQGNLAMALVAKAPADGYTLAIVPVGNAAVNPSLTVAALALRRAFISEGSLASRALPVHLRAVLRVA